MSIKFDINFHIRNGLVVKKLRYNIITALLLCIIILILSCSGLKYFGLGCAGKTECKTCRENESGLKHGVYFDDFKNINTASWFYRKDGLGFFKLTTDGLKLIVPEKTGNAAYSNADIHTRYDPLPYRYATAEFRLNNSGHAGGTRGWGFWDGIMDPKKSEIAWFYQHRGPFWDIRNDFYAITQGSGQRLDITRLDEDMILGLHEFCVEWRKHVV
jgi:hypothetical protein